MPETSVHVQDKNREISLLEREEGYGGNDLEKVRQTTKQEKYNWKLINMIKVEKKKNWQRLKAVDVYRHKNPGHSLEIMPTGKNFSTHYVR